MESDFLFGVSLTAAFLGGAAALFAPCCITFLFPSYLGTIFKAKKRVVFLTLVFALGLASILVPVALGMRAIVFFFDRYHTPVYLLGAGLMIFLGIMTFFEVKLSLPLPNYALPEKVGVFSTYLLGVFSGVTSSCCAPVLFAAITLSSLSPSMLTALIVSLVYVLGIVFPLFFLSLFYERLTNQSLYKIKTGFEKPLKILAAFTFIFSGLAIGYLTLTNRIVMEESYGSFVQKFIYEISARIKNPLVDLGVLALIVILFLLMLKEALNERGKK